MLNTVNHPMSRESHWQNDFTVLKPPTLQWFKLACVYVQLFEPTSLYKCGVFLCLVGRVCTNLREQLRAEALPGNTKLPAYTNSDSVGFLSEKVRHRVRARHGDVELPAVVSRGWAKADLHSGVCPLPTPSGISWQEVLQGKRGWGWAWDRRLRTPWIPLPSPAQWRSPHYSHGRTVLAGEARLFDLVNKILFTIFSQVVRLVKFNHYLLIIFKHRFYVVFTGCLQCSSESAGSIISSQGKEIIGAQFFL